MSQQRCILYTLIFLAVSSVFSVSVFSFVRFMSRMFKLVT